MSRRAVIAGWALVAVVAASAIHSGVVGALRFDRMGPLGVGREVPEFRVPLVDGGEFRRADLPGRVHVVTFWATWCPYCRDELDDLQAMADRWPDDAVRIVAVNREGGGVSVGEAMVMARQYRDAKGLGFGIGVDDGRMGKAFGVGGIPHTVVFDRTGRLREVFQGRVSGERIAGVIDAVVAER